MVDIPFSEDQDQAVDLSQKIVDFLKTMKIEDINLVQYRLSNDWDRGNKNYLDINENGHASNKKMKIVFSEETNELV